MKEVIIGAIILERVTELIKSKLSDKYKQHLDGLTISLILGVGFAVAYGLDAVGHFGLSTSVPFLNEVLTGVLLTGGAGVFNALVESIEAITVLAKEEE